MAFLGGIFGSGDVQAPPVNTSLPGFSGGGLTGKMTGAGLGDNYSVTADPNRTAAVGGLSDTFNTLGNLTGDLRSSVTPGFNDLLNTRLTSFNNNAASAIGTLNQNLQSRRILGSSFGQDTLTRAQNQFNQSRDAIVSDSFMQSLQANNQLLNQQYNAYSQAFQTNLNELNLEAGIANTMSSKVADILNQNARTEASLQEDASKATTKNNMDMASGLGSFLGKAALAPFTGGASLAIPSGLPGSQSAMGGGFGGASFG